MLKKLIIPPSQLSYHALGKMAIWILSFFILLSLAVRYSPKDSFYQSAVKLYQSEGLYAGEKALSSYLEKHPENQKAWISLIQWRIRFFKQIQRGLDQTAPPGLNLLLAQRFKYFLTEDEFNAKLKSCTVLTPAEIELIKLSETGLPLQLILTQTEPSNFTELSLSTISPNVFKAKTSDINPELNKQLRQLSQLHPNSKHSKQIIYYLDVLDEKVDSYNLPLIFGEWPVLDANLNDYFMENKQYLRANYHLVRSQIQGRSFLTIAMVALSGLAWLLLLMHLGHAWYWEKKHKWLIPLAIILGILSAHSTLIVAVMQDFFIQHDAREKTFFYNLVYYVLGVALREELVKLLFFLPLIPMLKNCRDNAVVFVLASIVGLGFAIEENINYYSAHALSDIIVSRFMTANFLHAALTGIAGFCLWNAFYRGGEHWQYFNTQVLKVIGMHGAYNFLLTDNSFGNLSYFAMTVFVLLTFEYIRTILYFSSYRHRECTLTQLFIACLSFVIGLNLLFLVYQSMNFSASLKIMASGILGLVLIAYAFLREFNEEVH